MALVAERWGLIPELQRFAREQRPIWGTCAGLIFLANRASGGPPGRRPVAGGGGGAGWMRGGGAVVVVCAAAGSAVALWVLACVGVCLQPCLNPAPAA